MIGEKMDKKVIRQEILRKRNAQTEQEREEKSIKIKEKLFCLPEFRKAKTIMFYLSFKSEVKTEKMVREALELQRRVVVPVVRKEQDVMCISEVKDYNNELRTGDYGILCPKKEFMREIPSDELDLVIVPGLVFDERGHRMGYGKGFYDRFLCDTKDRIPTIALAFESQIVGEVPIDNHDIQMDKVITEARIIKGRA